ncbi:MAG: DUF932 domain-containing protein [Sulfurimonas sp.]|nr:DUF932 domain-containing protein [Sulfurimonas sp.]
MSKLPLSETELMNYPVLYQTDPHEDASEKYSVIKTIDVIKELRDKYNWYPTSVQVAHTDDEKRKDKTVHCIRLKKFEDLISQKENVVELLIFNSLDRTKIFSISIGVYRYVCENSLVCGDTYEKFTLKHIGNLDENLAGIIQKIAEYKPQLEEKIKAFSSLILNEQEMDTFAKLSASLRWESHLDVDYQKLLIPKIDADKRDTSLYTVMNVIQNNILKPDSITGINTNTGRKFSTSREISSLTKDYEINSNLWNLAERIYQIKQPEAQALVA